MIKNRKVKYQDLPIWLNGELRTDPAISAWDHGFLYGDGCFEGLRVRNGHLYRASDHLARLERSAHALALALPYSRDELLIGVAQVVEANDLSDAHVRIIVSRGPGAPGLDPRRSPSPTVVVMAYPFPSLLGDEPVSLMISSIVRKAPLSVDGHIKSLNYLDGILAKIQANAAGADDAIMLDPAGRVAEGTSANVFIVSDGNVATPTATSALPGITRMTVIDLLRESGHAVGEREVSWGELYSADECFLTGTAAGIVAVGSIDGRDLREAPGPFTSLARTLYGEAVHDPAHSLPLSGVGH